MLKTIEELIDAISQGKVREHQYDNIELKSDWDTSYGNKISALANKPNRKVCWLVIGVDDLGGIVAHDEHWAIKKEEIISQHINQNLDPMQACQGINSYCLNNYWVIVVKIKNPGDVVKWKHTAYKASGTTMAEMRPEEVMQMTIQLPGLTDYSKQIYDKDISPELSETFKNKLLETREEMQINYKKSDPQEIFDAIKISKTNTCKILFGETRYRQIFYDADDNVVENDTVYGLFSILNDKFTGKIQAWAKTLSKQSGGEAFPELALKEGLANAVAHAAYYENDGEIIVEVFPDKVVVSNLCLPESSYFANKWFSRTHKTSNGLLMETLRLIKIVDELGRGKNIIFTDSLKNGKRPPIVAIEKAGRYNRWRLFIFGGASNVNHLKLYQRIKEQYEDEQKALIAYALVLWKDQSVSAIRKYIDGDSAPLFAEVLSDINGPIWYYQKNDEIVPQRWVKVLLEEGKDSKTFSPDEEKQFYNFSYTMQEKYHDGFITPKMFRKLAHFGDSKSEQVLSSKFLKKWEAEGKIIKKKKGVYKFKGETQAEEITFSKLLKLLEDKEM